MSATSSKIQSRPSCFGKFHKAFNITLTNGSYITIFSHNDVHEGNCLIDPNQMVDGKSEMEALRLIDFEYSNYGYR